MDLPIVSGIRFARENGLMSFIYKSLNYYAVYGPLWNTVTSRYPWGTNIYEFDWDILIILDACRPDFLYSLTDESDWVGDFRQIRSVGSMTAEWMLNTFTRDWKEEISRTAFISGNIWSHRVFNERFHEHKNHKFDVIHEGIPNWTPVSSEDFGHYETVYPFANQDHRIHPEAEHIPHILTSSPR